MYNHAPQNYKDPFYDIARGIEDETGEYIHTKQEDIFYRDDFITAFVASYWWPNNPGSVIVIPNAKVENLYDIDDELLSKIHIFSKKVATALKQVYQCDGVSIRQHNEPAGNQHVLHYHLNILPRYTGDELYVSHKQKRKTDPEERLVYAEKLQAYFKELNT